MGCQSWIVEVSLELEACHKRIITGFANLRSQPLVVETRRHGMRVVGC